MSSGAKTQQAPIPIQHEVLRPLLQEARLFVLEHDQLFVVVSSDSSREASKLAFGRPDS